MRLRVGPPPNSLSDSDMKSGEWTQLHGIPLCALQLLSLVSGCMIALPVLIFWLTIRRDLAPDLTATWEVPVVVLAVLGIGLLLQIACHPDRGLTKESMLGIWPQRLTPYTYFSGYISKGRYLLCLLLPTTLLITLPVAIALLSGNLSGWLAFISLVGALTHGINLFRAASFALRVPSGALIAGRGFAIYWRHGDRSVHHVAR